MGLKHVTGIWNQTQDPQKDQAVQSGGWTLDLQNIMRMRNTKTCAECPSDFHMECVHWMIDEGQTDGRWPDQPKNDNRQTI